MRESKEIKMKEEEEEEGEEATQTLVSFKLKKSF